MTPYTEINGLAAKAVHLHRIREAREERGMTRQQAARMLSITLPELERQEDPHCDLTISELRNWTELLGLEIDDLIVDQQVPFPRAALSNQNVSSFLDTVTKMLARSKCPAVKRLAETLTNQLREID
jgi:transcriptional regulator with XRE-family HTH domain